MHDFLPPALPKVAANNQSHTSKAYIIEYIIRSRVCYYLAKRYKP